ncbi:flagellar basal body rod protein FlgB [Litchfieldia salsa]|uniref:Flagellar basal body rod protein FlgB n=1 Tax=Litchfieldia salsa TaxID=930152 RepID=A0A1H0R7U8_9BACI|nr:flagellar basal body rod protein FlgB [Litchfieldia salsa]SDP25603.1 flagellar basal-body rod protein FlgB [Litchfieldia salsa]
MKIFSGTINSLEQALKYASTKQKAISHNIANVDTPNYKAKDVTFKTDLTNSMRALKTSEKHVEFTGGRTGGINITTKTGTMFNHNGNNVDIDKEMASLAKNQIYFNAVADRISSKFNSLKTVVKGGK